MTRQTCSGKMLCRRGGKISGKSAATTATNPAQAIGIDMRRDSDLYSTLSYILSVLMLSAQNVVEFMDKHMGFIGGSLGIATFLLNWYYQHKRARFEQNE